MRRALASALVLALLCPAAPWAAAVRGAAHYARTRSGVVCFAVVDDRGRIHGRGRHVRQFSASLLKPVILGTYRRSGRCATGPCRGRVVSLTILTDGDPSHAYGTDTVRGVARRLLAPLSRRCRACRPCAARPATGRRGP